MSLWCFLFELLPKLLQVKTSSSSLSPFLCQICSYAENISDKKLHTKLQVLKTLTYFKDQNLRKCCFRKTEHCFFVFCVLRIIAILWQQIKYSVSLILDYIFVIVIN